jgi:hypothetical protein
MRCAAVVAMPAHWHRLLDVDARPARAMPEAPPVPALIAGPLAFVMEMGKLFVSGKQPDPTDVLIAMVAAAGLCVATHDPGRRPGRAARCAGDAR